MFRFNRRKIYACSLIQRGRAPSTIVSFHSNLGPSSHWPYHYNAVRYWCLELGSKHLGQRHQTSPRRSLPSMTEFPALDAL